MRHAALILGLVAALMAASSAPAAPAQKTYVTGRATCDGWPLAEADPATSMAAAATPARAIWWILTSVSSGLFVLGLPRQASMTRHSPSRTLSFGKATLAGRCGAGGVTNPGDALS